MTEAKRDGPLLSATTMWKSDGDIEQLIKSGWLDPPSRPGLLGQLDRYEIIQILGSGGMGVVLLARDPSDRSEVAIKLIKPEMADLPRATHRFLVEARHMSNLKHDNILKVFDVVDRPRGPYYVMPHISGGALSSMLANNEPLEQEVTSSVALQIAAALDHAHGRGIIHRDLKPDNILFDQYERHAWLTDFGLLRTVYNDSIVDVRGSQCEGTAPYMSPAVAAGQAEDTRCDIYSFGALLYEMLTGQPPYTGADTATVLRQIIAGPPLPIRQVNSKAPEDLVKIAEGAMARTHRDRYASMADIAADLQRVEQGKPVLGVHDQPTTRPWRAIKWLAACLLVACLVVLITAWQPDSKPASREQTDGPSLPVAQLDTKNALRFSGKGRMGGDYILVNRLKTDPENTTPLTLEGWAAPEYRTTKYGVEMRGIVVGNKGKSGMGFGIEADDRWYTSIHDKEQFVKAYSDRPAEEGKFVHVAAVFDGKSLKLFVDGLLQKDVKEMTSIHKHSPHPFMIGADPYGSGSGVKPHYPFYGVIDEVRISTVARYDKDFIPARRFEADGPTAALFHFDEGSGDLVRDASSNNYHGGIVGAKWVSAPLKTSPPLAGNVRPALKTNPPDADNVRPTPKKDQVLDQKLFPGEVGRLCGHQAVVNCLSVSPDGKKLLSASDDGTVRLWDLGTRKEIRRLDFPMTTAKAVVFDPDGKRALTGTGTGESELWDVINGKQIRRLQLEGAVTGLAISSKGSHMAISSANEGVRIGDRKTGVFRKFTSKSRNPKPNSLPRGPALSADGKRVMFVGVTGCVVIYEETKKGGKIKYEQIQKLDDATFARFSADAKRALTGGVDHSVRLWDVDTGEQIHEFNGHSGTVTTAVFSPDERHVLSGGCDNTIRLWDVSTSKQIHEIHTGDNDTSHHVAFLPDGRAVSAGGKPESGSYAIRIWQLPIDP